MEEIKISKKSEKKYFSAVHTNYKMNCIGYILNVDEDNKEFKSKTIFYGSDRYGLDKNHIIKFDELNALRFIKKQEFEDIKQDIFKCIKI